MCGCVMFSSDDVQYMMTSENPFWKDVLTAWSHVQLYFHKQQKSIYMDELPYQSGRQTDFVGETLQQGTKVSTSTV